MDTINFLNIKPGQRWFYDGPDEHGIDVQLIYEVLEVINYKDTILVNVKLIQVIKGENISEYMKYEEDVDLFEQTDNKNCYSYLKGQDAPIP